MNQQEQSKQIGQLIAKCWADEDFKQKLLADTMAMLKAEGVELPADLTVKVVENTESVFHLVIPAKPTDLSDDDLDKVAGGVRPIPSRAIPRPPSPYTSAPKPTIVSGFTLDD